MRRIVQAILLALTAQCLGLAPLPVASAATFTITNDSRVAAGPRVVSFGHVFATGEIRPGETPSVHLNAREAPSQLDAKALYPDGSVRHGIVSVEIADLPAWGQLAGVIDGPAGRSTRSAEAMATPPLVATLTFHGGPTATFDLKALAAKAPRSPPWLDGPLAQEQRYWSPPVNGVHVAFDVWTPRRGPPRVDVIFHNDLAQNGAIATQRYDVSLTGVGPALQLTGISHYPYAVWRRTLYADGLQPPRVTPDTARLAELGATPRYRRVQPDHAVAQGLHDAALRDGQAALPIAGLTAYMPTGGGRPDIGPLPTWAVFYLLDPSRQNQETLFANAEAAGSIPWHVRDATTDGPISIDRRPDLWLDDRGAVPPTPTGRPYRLPATPWFPDTAHQPSLSYLPYLLTGSQFHRDEMEMQAAYALLSVDPQFRGGASGVIIGQQVRELAWTLRTLATAAYILPADDPWQAYFQAKLDANLDQLLRRYVNGDEAANAGELKGFLPGPYAVEGAVAPWQGDYAAMVLGWIHDMGVPQARPLLAWMANFSAGRFTNGARGYDPIYGTPYYLYVADPKTHAPIGRWSEAFRATFDSATPVATLDGPDWGGGYAALARGALASIVNATGSPAAREALAYVERQTPRMDANYAKDPTFAIALRER